MHSRWKVSACIRMPSGPRSAVIRLARAKSRSPVRIATLLPYVTWAAGTPRRTGASSMTSSWYSDARCVVSTLTAALTTWSVTPLPSCAMRSVRVGRIRLPPADSRYRLVVSASVSAERMASSRPCSTSSRPSSTAVMNRRSAGLANIRSPMPSDARRLGARRATGTLGFKWCSVFGGRVREEVPVSCRSARHAAARRCPGGLGAPWRDGRRTRARSRRRACVRGAVRRYRPSGCGTPPS